MLLSERTRTTRDFPTVELSRRTQLSSVRRSLIFVLFLVSFRGFCDCRGLGLEQTICRRCVDAIRGCNVGDTVWSINIELQT